MTNSEIADQLSLLSKLIDIHGENAEQAKALATAAFTLEKIPQTVSKLSEEKLFALRNIGENVGRTILEIIQTEESEQLKRLLEATPEGVLQMLNIKGLGPKKINVLWKQLRIDNIKELQKACIEHRLSALKGFGEKTEQKILDAIQFKKGNDGKYLYASIEDFTKDLHLKLKSKFPDNSFEITGEFRRQLEVISILEWVTTAPKEELKNYLLRTETEVLEESNDQMTLLANGSVKLRFHLSNEKSFAEKLFETSSSDEFLAEWRKKFSPTTAQTEEQIFLAQKLNFIPAFLRENTNSIDAAKRNSFDNLIQVDDIKGLIHSHSNWSDGVSTIEKMAEALVELGFEYMVISDHSKAAFYANGLSEQKIIQQHKYVDELNAKLHPFKIFKSIECDILSDGSLDYDNDVLSTFDLVITSIHSNLQMNEEKAMMRLLGAINNPFTTILGHMTGRKLLQRNGYPVDHKAIIDACAENNVVIEINANPNRLDMDWRWIDYALEKNVMLSIDPDAHSIYEFQYVKYGVLVAQKGGLTAGNNLSSMSLKDFEAFLNTTKKKKKIN